MSNSNLLDGLVQQARARTDGRRSVGAYQQATNAVVGSLRGTLGLRGLLPYLQQLRAKMRAEVYERELEAAMPAPARQVVLALDGQYVRMDGAGQRALAAAILQLLDDYIFEQLRKYSDWRCVGPSGASRNQ